MKHNAIVSTDHCGLEIIGRVIDSGPKGLRIQPLSLPIEPFWAPEHGCYRCLLVGKVVAMLEGGTFRAGTVNRENEDWFGFAGRTEPYEKRHVISVARQKTPSLS